LDQSESARIEILDVVCKTVFSHPGQNENAGRHTCSANVDTPGLYFVRVTIGNETTISKLVIAK
jgi:hypothetical protein